MDISNLHDSYRLDLYNPRNLQTGDHVCTIYKNDEEFKTSIIDFIIQGLTENQKIFYVIDHSTRDQLLTFLNEKGIEANQFIEKGQLQFLMSAEAYLKDQHFDYRKMIALLKEECNLALSEGYSALRVTGEMSWALKELENINSLIEYESLITEEFYNHYKCTGMCQYDLRKFDFNTLNRIIDTHPLCYFENQLYANQFYIPPQLYLSPSQNQHIFNHKVIQIKNRKEREESASQLYTQMEELKQFGYMIAHDLKSPIQSASVLNSMLEVEYGIHLSSEIKNIIQKSSKLLLEARTRLESLEDLSHIANERKGLNPLNVNHILLEIINNFKPIIEEAKGEIHCELSEIPSLKIDKNHFVRVLTNLIENSLQYRKVDETLLIFIKTTYSSNKGIIIQIQDNGMGVDESQRKKIFHPFYRLHTSNNIPGIGLGLTVCQRIMRKYKGEAIAESSGQKGMKITLNFPVNKSIEFH